MNTIATRSEITNLIPNNSIGCELGVFLCEYSDTLLNSKKFAKLYLVDTFTGTIGSGDVDGNNIKIFSGDYLLDNAINKYKDNNIVTIEKIDSISFLTNKQDCFFDFIYIDTIHEYDHLSNELIQSYRTVKNGGLICGHDYHNDIFPGVVASVKDFCDKYKLHYSLTTKDKLASFVIEKRV